MIAGSGTTYKWDNNFAIGVSLEVVWLLQILANDSVVVDLTIDGERDGLVGVGEWLSTGLCEV